MKVKVFTTTDCPKCQQVKQRLKKENVQYEEINIEKGPDEMSEFYFYSDLATMPMIVITNPNPLDNDILDMSDLFVMQTDTEIEKAFDIIKQMQDGKQT